MIKYNIPSIQKQHDAFKFRGPVKRFVISSVHDDNHRTRDRGGVDRSIIDLIVDIEGANGL